MHMGISDLLTSCLTPHPYSFLVFMMEQWQTMKWSLCWRLFNAAYILLPKCWMSHKRFSAIVVLCEPGFIHFNMVWCHTIIKVIPSSCTMKTNIVVQCASLDEHLQPTYWPTLTLSLQVWRVQHDYIFFSFCLMVFLALNTSSLPHLHTGHFKYLSDLTLDKELNLPTEVQNEFI